MTTSRGRPAAGSADSTSPLSATTRPGRATALTRASGGGGAVRCWLGQLVQGVRGGDDPLAGERLDPGAENRRVLEGGRFQLGLDLQGHRVAGPVQGGQPLVDGDVLRVTR